MDAIISQLTKSLIYIMSALDPVYLVIFMLTSYLLLTNFSLQFKGKPIKDKRIVLFVGVFFAIVFSLLKIFFGLPWHNPSPDAQIVSTVPYGFVLAFSFLFGQFLNKYGIVRLVELILAKVGIVFNSILNKFISK